MANRRRFLQVGAGVSTLPFITGLKLPTLDLEVKSSKTDFFLYDDRYVESTFVSSISNFYKGAHIHVVNDDLTDFWYEHLDTSWKQKPITVAGVTTQEIAFMLEQLGWIYGIRNVFRKKYIEIENNQNSLISWMLSYS